MMKATTPPPIEDRPREEVGRYNTVRTEDDDESDDTVPQKRIVTNLPIP